jgi:hypothetical protein
MPLGEYGTDNINTDHYDIYKKKIYSQCSPKRI